MARNWRNPRQWPGAAWAAFTSSLLIVTCPCWCLPIWAWVEYDDHKIRKRNSDKEFQKRRAGYLPDPLPEIRERELAMPLEHPVPVRESQSRLKMKRTVVTMQQTKAQPQCSLLRKLPLDVRLLIWEHYLGGELLHIVREPGRLGYIICPFWDIDFPLLGITRNLRSSSQNTVAQWASPEFTSNHICWSPQDTDGLSYARTNESKIFGLSAFRKRSFLPLLQTCRQIYTEALPILYQSNAFDIKSLDTLLSLPRTTLHVNLIRSLYLSWNFRADPLEPPSNVNQNLGRPILSTEASPPWDLSTWLKACDFLGSMKGLQELTVTIEGGQWVSSNPESASQLLLPLTAVKVGKRFEVHVPWEENPWEDAIVAIVEVQKQNHRQGNPDPRAWPEDLGKAEKILMQPADEENRFKRRKMALDTWVRLLKLRNQTDEVEPSTTSFIKGVDVEKAQLVDILACDVDKRDCKVGFEIVRREELLGVTRLPVFPARKRRTRDRAFGRR